MTSEDRPATSTPAGLVLLAWVVVTAPLAWGVLHTFEKVAALFR